VSLQADQTDTITFISLPRLDAATQKSAWFTHLEQHGIVFRIDPIERQALPRWIELRLQRQKQRVPAGEIGRRMLGFIADKVEGNLLAAHQEINKLALLYPEGELSEEDVQQAVLNVARYDVFKLSEAILAGDIARTVRMLNGLEGEGEAPVLVLWALTEEIRTMQRVLALQQEGKPWGTITRELRIWGARERMLPKALPRFTIERLNAALMIAADMDTLIKGLKPSTLPTDPWVALQELALELAR
jgi:DNA polymerase III subunit delta